MTRTEKRELGALTGIRVVAAVWIVVHHYGRQHLSAGPQWAYTLLCNGYFLVDLFFLLSGFIMAYIYLNPGEERSIDFRSFWVARLARIYPVYLFALLLSLLVYLRLRPVSLESPFSLRGIVIYVFMLQAWLPGITVVDLPEFPNPPAWAISAEVFFYLIFPFIVPRLRSPNPKMLVLAILGLLLFNTVMLGILSIPGGRTIPLRAVWSLPEFFIGIALGRLFLYEEARGGGKTKMRLFGWLSLAATIGIVLLMSLTTNFVLLAATVVPLFAVLIYCLAHGSGMAAALIGRHPFIFLGNASYCIYILQDPVLRWSQRAMYKLPLVDPALPTFFLLYLSVLIIMSVIFLYLLEIPARKLIRNLISKAVLLPSSGPQRA